MLEKLQWYSVFYSVLFGFYSNLISANLEARTGNHCWDTLLPVLEADGLNYF